MENVVGVVIFSILGSIALLISYRQHKEKGFIFNNTWLYASKKERDEMDKRLIGVLYRVSRNVFFMLGITFFLHVIYIAAEFSWLLYFITAIIIAIIVYAIVGSVQTLRLQNLIENEKKFERNK